MERDKWVVRRCVSATDIRTSDEVFFSATSFHSYTSHDANFADEQDDVDGSFRFWRTDSRHSLHFSATSDEFSCADAARACDPEWVEDARSRIRHAALEVVEAQQRYAEHNRRLNDMAGLATSCELSPRVVPSRAASSRPVRNAGSSAKSQASLDLHGRRTASRGCDVSKGRRVGARKGRGKLLGLVLGFLPWMRV
ncbi:hypothetical protein CLOP_g2457 [Closterium sp. NIES-67]|nr:hypothetical protein CLOP_g25278 [Closterium sp. NIES-67]GJP71642.1 hypothetical protein CLOP_g2457 [Closterium sp. NIES-67]